MCGRYVSVSSPTILAERFRVEEVRVEVTEPSYNVTPRAEVPVVAVSQGRRVLDVVRWGLVPSWAKDLKIGDRQINAAPSESRPPTRTSGRSRSAAASSPPTASTNGRRSNPTHRGRSSNRGSSAGGMVSRSRSRGCGKSGTTARRATTRRAFARASSSRPKRTRSCSRSTNACQSCCRSRRGPSGLIATTTTSRGCNGCWCPLRWTTSRRGRSPSS